jgi:hypothetical protein
MKVSRHSKGINSAMKSLILLLGLMTLSSSTYADSGAQSASALSASSVPAKCPDDYYGVYFISSTDYVAIETSETRQMSMIFGGNDYVATVNGDSAVVTISDADGKTKQVSFSFSCDSSGFLDLNIDGTQHNFSKSGSDLVVDGKTYPIDEDQ